MQTVLIYWTEKDDQYLKAFSQTKSIPELAKKLNRTPNSIRNRISLLKLTKTDQVNWINNKWDPKNDQLLIKYSPKNSIIDLALVFRCSRYMIVKRQKQLNIYQKKDTATNWSSTEIDVLTRNSQTMEISELSNLLHRSENSIRNKIHRLHLPKKKQSSKKPKRPAKRKEWTSIEIRWLTNNYATASWNEMINKLHRPKISICNKASKLNIRRRSLSHARTLPRSPVYAHNKWSAKEKQYLADHYSDMSVNDLALTLNRTYQSVYEQIKNIKNNE